MRNTTRLITIFCKIILLGSPFGAAAQSIHITSGAHLVQQGRIYMMLNNMGFVNDGSFDGGTGGIVQFLGNAPSSVARIGGTSSTPFGNLLIAKSSGDVLLNQNITINLALSMLLGNVELNGQTITMGHHGTITRETETGHITGANGGSIVATSDILANTATNPGNLGAELLIPGVTGTIAGTFTVVRKQIAEFLGHGLQGGINRSYTITRVSGTPVTGQLRFGYLNAELNGLDPSQLNWWTLDSTGSTFTEQAKDSSNVTAKWVVKSGMNVIGKFTLGPDLQGGLIQPGGSRTGTKPANRSDSAALTKETAGGGMKVYPNPAHDNITITLFSKDTKDRVIGLYDQSGRLMQQKTIHCVAGSNQLHWDLSGYSAGIYYLSCNAPGTKNIKIVRE